LLYDRALEEYRLGVVFDLVGAIKYNESYRSNSLFTRIKTRLS
jgi:hypothetical protein